MVKVNIEKSDLNTHFRHIEVGNFFIVSDELYIKILCYDSVENAINLGNGHKVKFKNSDEVIRPQFIDSGWKITAVTYYEDKVCGIICKADHRKGITIRTLT